jgi:hypothetical protein
VINSSSTSQEPPSAFKGWVCQKLRPIQCMERNFEVFQIGGEIETWHHNQILLKQKIGILKRFISKFELGRLLMTYSYPNFFMLSLQNVIIATDTIQRQWEIACDFILYNPDVKDSKLRNGFFPWMKCGDGYFYESSEYLIEVGVFLKFVCQ